MKATTPYSLEDLAEAVAQIETEHEIPFTGLRLGKPWIGVVKHGDFVRGLKVTIVHSLEERQPYAMTDEAYGCLEIPIRMGRAVSRQLVELFRSGDFWVEAPYSRHAGSNNMAQVEFRDPVKTNQLNCLFNSTIPPNNGRYDLLDGVQLIANRAYYLIWDDIPKGATIVDWAIANLNAQVDTTQLLKKKAELLRDIKMIRPYLRKYAKTITT